MNSGATRIKVGDALIPASREERLDPLSEYRLLGVRLDGQGPFQREVKLGREVAATHLFRVKKGDFIFSRLFAWRGAFGVVPEELDSCYVSAEFPSFTPRDGCIDPKYLFYWFRLPQTLRAVEAECSGSTPLTRNRFKEEAFLRQEIPLPPLAEQQRVVSRIEDLSCRISEAAAARLQVANGTAALRSGALGVVYDRLTRQWPIVPFGDLEPHVTSGPRNWARNYARGGFRFYRAQDVGPDGSTLENSKVFVVPPTDGTQGRNAQVGPGDLLIVITGATVGRCALVTSVHEPGFVSQHVALCRLPVTSIDSAFALAMLMCPQGQAQLLGQRYGQGKPGLNLGSVKALRVPVPPLSEQRRTIRELNAFRSRVTGLESLQTRVASELDALLPSILDKAFRGEL